MFKKLQKKWRVNNQDFFWIILCFAVTGTTTAWVSKAITTWVAVNKYSLSWWALKVTVLLIGYQVFLLFFGFCFGKFGFFWKYEKKLLSHLGILPRDKPQIHLAIFASGAGSNAQKIIDHFQYHPNISVSIIVCNKREAGVINIARDHNIELLQIKKTDLASEPFLRKLNERKVDWIILAGFLLKIPVDIIKAYPERIINIHPALLPAYGGEGMYGQRVHEAVISNKETKSGISIHYVDELYDHGKIIAQYHFAVDEMDTPETLAKKIHALEHQYFASTIETLILNAK